MPCQPGYRASSKRKANSIKDKDASKQTAIRKLRSDDLKDELPGTSKAYTVAVLQGANNMDIQDISPTSWTLETHNTDLQPSCASHIQNKDTGAANSPLPENLTFSHKRNLAIDYVHSQPEMVYKHKTINWNNSVMDVNADSVCSKDVGDKSTDGFMIRDVNEKSREYFCYEDVNEKKNDDFYHIDISKVNDVFCVKGVNKNRNEDFCSSFVNEKDIVEFHFKNFDKITINNLCSKDVKENINDDFSFRINEDRTDDMGATVTSEKTIHNSEENPMDMDLVSSNAIIRVNKSTLGSSPVLQSSCTDLRPSNVWKGSEHLWAMSKYNEDDPVISNTPIQAIPLNGCTSFSQSTIFTSSYNKALQVNTSMKATDDIRSGCFISQQKQSSLGTSEKTLVSGTNMESQTTRFMKRKADKQLFSSQPQMKTSKLFSGQPQIKKFKPPLIKTDQTKDSVYYQIQDVHIHNDNHIYNQSLSDNVGDVGAGTLHVLQELEDTLLHNTAIGMNTSCKDYTTEKVENGFQVTNVETREVTVEEHLATKQCIKDGSLHDSLIVVNEEAIQENKKSESICSYSTGIRENKCCIGDMMGTTENGLGTMANVETSEVTVERKYLSRPQSGDSSQQDDDGSSNVVCLPDCAQVNQELSLLHCSHHRRLLEDLQLSQDLDHIQVHKELQLSQHPEHGKILDDLQMPQHPDHGKIHDDLQLSQYPDHIKMHNDLQMSQHPDPIKVHDNLQLSQHSDHGKIHDDLQLSHLDHIKNHDEQLSQHSDHGKIHDDLQLSQHLDHIKVHDEQLSQHPDLGKIHDDLQLSQHPDHGKIHDDLQLSQHPDHSKMHDNLQMSQHPDPIKMHDNLQLSQHSDLGRRHDGLQLSQHSDHGKMHDDLHMSQHPDPIKVHDDPQLSQHSDHGNIHDDLLLSQHSDPVKVHDDLQLSQHQDHIKTHDDLQLSKHPDLGKIHNDLQLSQHPDHGKINDDLQSSQHPDHTKVHDELQLLQHPDLVKVHDELLSQHPNNIKDKLETTTVQKYKLETTAVQENKLKATSVHGDKPETTSVQDDKLKKSPVQEDIFETAPVQVDTFHTIPVQEDKLETTPVQEDKAETTSVQEDKLETAQVAKDKLEIALQSSYGPIQSDGSLVFGSCTAEKKTHSQQPNILLNMIDLVNSTLDDSTGTSPVNMFNSGKENSTPDNSKGKLPVNMIDPVKENSTINNSTGAFLFSPHKTNTTNMQVKACNDPVRMNSLPSNISNRDNEGSKFNNSDCTGETALHRDIHPVSMEITEDTSSVSRHSLTYNDGRGIDASIGSDTKTSKMFLVSGKTDTGVDQGRSEPINVCFPRANELVSSGRDKCFPSRNEVSSESEKCMTNENKFLSASEKFFPGGYESMILNGNDKSVASRREKCFHNGHSFLDVSDKSVPSGSEESMMEKQEAFDNLNCYSLANLLQTSGLQSHTVVCHQSKTVTAHSVSGHIKTLSEPSDCLDSIHEGIFSPTQNLQELENPENTRQLLNNPVSETYKTQQKLSSIGSTEDLSDSQICQLESEDFEHDFDSNDTGSVSNVEDTVHQDIFKHNFSMAQARSVTDIEHRKAEGKKLTDTIIADIVSINKQLLRMKREMEIMNRVVQQNNKKAEFSFNGKYGYRF